MKTRKIAKNGTTNRLTERLDWAQRDFLACDIRFRAGQAMALEAIPEPAAWEHLVLDTEFH